MNLIPLQNMEARHSFLSEEMFKAFYRLREAAKKKKIGRATKVLA